MSFKNLKNLYTAAVLTTASYGAFGQTSSPAPRKIAVDRLEDLEYRMEAGKHIRDNIDLYVRNAKELRQNGFNITGGTIGINTAHQVIATLVFKKDMEMLVADDSRKIIGKILMEQEYHVGLRDRNMDGDLSNETDYGYEYIAYTYVQKDKGDKVVAASHEQAWLEKDAIRTKMEFKDANQGIICKQTLTEGNKGALRLSEDPVTSSALSTMTRWGIDIWNKTFPEIKSGFLNTFISGGVKTGPKVGGEFITHLDMK